MAAKIQISEQATLQIGLTYCRKPTVTSKPPMLRRVDSYYKAGKKLKPSGYVLRPSISGNVYNWAIVKFGFYNCINWYYMGSPIDCWYALIPGHALRMDENSVIDALKFIELNSWEEWVKQHEYLDHSKERAAALLEAYAKEDLL